MKTEESGQARLDGVVMAFDNAYSTHGACTILSLLDIAGGDFARLYIVSVGLCSDIKGKLSEIVKRYDVSIEFLDLGEEEIEQAGLSLETYGKVEVDYVTPATYARLFLDVLLVSVSGRYLYLDADTIVINRIVELAEVELRGGLGAVSDPGISSLLDPEGIQCPELVSGLVDGPYFNAGVLLLDLEKLRHDDFFVRARKYARDARGRMLLYDQEALNAAANGRYTELGPKWNYMTHGDIDRSDLDNVGVCIRHFCSHVKPWDDPAHDDDAYLYVERAREFESWGW